MSPMPLLEIRNISKVYGSTTVLSDVTFTLERGETVAVIGQNGAGKSTFSKIVAGVVEPTEGEIYVDGEMVSLYPPRNALKHGIAFIPQELAYVPELTVAENVMLGRWPKKNGRVSHREMVRQTMEQAQHFGIQIDVEKKMSQLKLADKQLVEILKALSKRARIILLDEPTASLTDNESKNLFRMVGRLAREEDVGIIYVSHRMDEVFQFSDRVDVFRNGRHVASEPTRGSDHETLIYHMLGHKKENLDSIASRSNRGRKCVVELCNWSNNGIPTISNLNLSVHEGEIVGLFGVRGCGAETIAEGVVGLNTDISGELVFEGNTRLLFKSPREAQNAGIAYVPPDRKKQGLVLNLSVQTNTTLLVLRKMLNRLRMLDFRKERKLTQNLSARFNLKYQGLWQSVGELSGGNQQKVLLSSRLALAPKLLVLQEPTRGVDIGARLEIHRELRAIANEGTATLVVTSDIEEAIILCDRLMIMRDGQVMGELSGETKTQQEALRLASGGA
ncbi:sugar ABC transporter ATP-binding protein [Paenibacillus sp. 7124]|uniref:Sugar ABC transporter ATP-binding protein n=1 Tax=Paenibacillus apii TaxID=1850370 RepID=A0A6M1PYG5_9BACL|nr:sugar ABC transporter ATP-binding protein [Paenibacillus apii]NGM85261.1 sugar ABC transporter ATP-binding protein [Paenibacillus apii]